MMGCGKPAEERVPELIELLSNRESAVRNRAALELGGYGKKAKSAVPALILLLDDPNGGVQTSAAYALRQINTQEAQEALNKKSGFKNRQKNN